jgi:tRNA threonylcarbamoyladenosine dehydratase
MSTASYRRWSPSWGGPRSPCCAERIGQINPACVVECVDDFVSVDKSLLTGIGRTTGSLDCIDDFRVKAALIALCRRRAPGDRDGRRCRRAVASRWRVRVGDLRKTEQDPLLARTRKLLRQAYGFPSNPRRRFGVPCVWSDEPQLTPGATARRTVAGSLTVPVTARCMPVTAAFGLAAAAHVINQSASRGDVGRLQAQSSSSPP